MEPKTDQLQQLRKILDIALRRKTLILSFILLATTAGLAYYLQQPKIYQSSALLSFQQQKVQSTTMAPDMKGRIHDVISTISQIVLSRTSLEKIIENQNLYFEQRQRVSMQDVVEGMRKKVNIASSRRGDTFSIIFSDGNANIVARVANTLAARFIEENLKYRQERASETSNYAQNELDMSKETLDKKEAILRDYKLKYYNEMPDQRETNMGRLTALQTQYQNKQESIQDLERTRVLIQDQITARRQLLEMYFNSKKSTPTPEKPEKAYSNREQLDRLKAYFVSLQDRYTDQHPKIRSLSKKIKRLEEVVASEKKPELKTDIQAVDQSTGEVLDKPLFDLQLQIKKIGLEIAKIQKEMKGLQVQIEKYEKWVAAAPVREAEWSAITREYGQLKRHYEFLVSQNLQAKSAMNLEKKQQGSQFKIEDPARAPIKPVKPNFLKIIAMAVLVGSGLGAGLALGIEFLDTSYRDPNGLEDAFGHEVICSIPNLSLKNEIVKQRVWFSLSLAVFFMYSISLLGAVFYFWKKGQIVL